MFLAIDIGNTNVTVGIYDGESWMLSMRVPSNKKILNGLASLSKFKISASAISSVVPNLTADYEEEVYNLFQIESHIINNKNAGIKLLVDSPSDVGIDRICNVAAAQNLVGVPAIIGDIGSATNYDVVDENGAFIGGAIAPGIEVAAHHLIQRAALLKEAAFVVPPYAIGRSTESNLQSGIMLGAIDVVDGMLQRIMNETGWKEPHVIITGGFGKLISKHLQTKHTLMPELTLDGIRVIHGG